MAIERVRFLETVQVKDREGRIFEAGQEYDLPPASARRWITRGKAESALPGDPEPEAPEPVPINIEKKSTRRRGRKKTEEA